MKMIINIAEILSADLKSRTSVGDLNLYINNSNEKEIAIDFKDVKFVTRSFIDEFYNVFIKKPNPLCTVEIINAPQDIQLIFDSVSKTQDKKKDISNTGSVVQLDTIEDTRTFLQSLVL